MIVLLFFSLLPLLVEASHSTSKHYRPLLNCIVCNSLVNSTCAKSGEHLSYFNQTCPNKSIKNKIIKPVGCRVSYQTIPGLIHYPEKIKIVSRECSYNKLFKEAKFEGSSHSSPAIKYEAVQCFYNKQGELPCNFKTRLLPSIASVFLIWVGIL